jgi:hypothetical protein
VASEAAARPARGAQMREFVDFFNLCLQNRILVQVVIVNLMRME